MKMWYFLFFRNKISEKKIEKLILQGENGMNTWIQVYTFHGEKCAGM